jgi:hypothetical protein
MIVLAATLFFSCADRVTGYLDVANAEYIPDSLVIPRYADLDPIADATRIENNSPWVSLRIQGVLGTPPVYYSVASAREVNGGDTGKFLAGVSMIGGGIFYFPLQHETPPGRYIVSVRVHNEGHDMVIPDAFTFIVK